MKAMCSYHGMFIRIREAGQCGDTSIFGETRLCRNQSITRFSKFLTHSIHGAGIFTYIWLILMVNVGKYTIHGSYGFCHLKQL